MIKTGTTRWGKWTLTLKQTGDYEGFVFLTAVTNDGKYERQHMWEPGIDMTKEQIDNALKIAKLRIDKERRNDRKRY